MDVCIRFRAKCRENRASRMLFFLTETSNAENKATVYLIFTDMPARTRTWSSSHFYSRYITVNLRVEYLWFSGYRTDNPTLPSLLSILKDFPVRQYVQAACDTEGTSVILILCMCSFLNTARTRAWNQLTRAPYELVKTLLVLMTDEISEGLGMHVCLHNIVRVSLTNKV